jgi:hypothetical protein
VAAQRRARRRAARRRWQLQQANCARETAKLAAAGDDAAGADIAA